MQDLDAYLKELRKRGYRVERKRRSSHWKIYAPDGRFVSTSSGTPSDWRGLLNLRARVRAVEEGRA